MKRLWFALGTVLFGLCVMTGSAAGTTQYPNVAAAYSKGKGNYDVVVGAPAGATMALYVNDKNPVRATVNKQHWATFHKVKLTNHAKLSFTNVYKQKNGTTEKPINYVRYASVSGSKIGFTATAKVATQPPASEMPTPTAAPTPAATPAPTDTPAATSVNTGVNDTNLSNNNTYTNTDGNTVHSPADSTDGSVPAGATAQCRDGSYSFSQHRSGTCSYHGGVASWL